jgi:hypothetical protein
MAEENHHSGGNHADSVAHDIHQDVDVTVDVGDKSGSDDSVRSFTEIDFSQKGSREFVLTQRDLLQTEYEEINAHLRSDEYLTAAVRLNALFESYVEFLLRAEYRDSLDRQLTEKESDTIERMGHGDRLKTAKELGIVGEHIQGAISALNTVRNVAAHQIWTGVEVDSDFRNSVRHAHTQLSDHIDHLTEHHLTKKE